MANPEQTTDLGLDDGGLEGADLEGTAEGDRECGTESKLQAFLNGGGKGEGYAEKKKPLNLLDLPVDVLKDIIKEVTHTNDLASLALTHSSLHALTIPHIYHRFDIVWPDAHATAEHRTGVDALTYGLATLVMAEEVFGESPDQRCLTPNSPAQTLPCERCGHISPPQASPNNGLNPVQRPRRCRRGNHYSHFTRKFSLGNGPPEWVSDYLVTKDGGKMLGTLVALAVARMPNLETFVWDMPTGVLRDVWLALSSLGDHRDGREPRLERVWVRWHDNQENPPVGGQTLLPSLPPPLPLGSASVGFLVPPGSAAGFAGLPAATGNPQSPPANRVEHPTFSVLPPLKSLSVLDIDELAYLDEMSILISRSQDRLRELRVGISSCSGMPKIWVLPWDGESLQQVDHNMSSTGISTVGEKRLGGVLGILVGRVYDIRKRKRKAKTEATKNEDGLTQVPEGVQSNTPANQAELAASLMDSEAPGADTLDIHVMEETPSQYIATAGEPQSSSADVGEEPSALMPSVLLGGYQNTQANETYSSPSSAAVYTPASTQASPGLPPTILTDVAASNDGFLPSSQISQSIQAPVPTSTPISASQVAIAPGDGEPQRPVLEGKLKLEVLELERVPLCIPVLQKAFDWSIMTSVTLLGCSSSEYLWKMLRQVFSPYSSNKCGSSSKNRTPCPGSSRSLRGAGPPDYKLKLKKIHTDAVGPALIALLRETLAPNTLEVLFLQESSSLSSPVGVDAMYRGPLRRHRLSLKKLFVDSSIKPRSGTISQASWRKWMFPREVLGYVTSGKMSNLRELGMAVEYKDWHYLLQRLPLIPHLRSLYIPHIADHVHKSPDPREMALQVVDIVTLRPELEICYMGIMNKCFEILENRNNDEPQPISIPHIAPINNDPGDPIDDDDATEDEDDDEDDEENGPPAGIPGIDSDDTDAEDSDPLDDSDGGDNYESEEFRSRPKLRLREILFYDDKVAIFKARHGKL
ncbi:hypothetical protein FGG08_002722 [Glutinoglossum americanum]|uniref:F-box domain-containing protein n=1 Tax=Glutinoglossum americanum TaxID=1670608 RepID=A0A9P8HZQ6_9PEZI|nr:hypothetical protein FGG08_002722 [Glutinoglossum americanum]